MGTLQCTYLLQQMTHQGKTVFQQKRSPEAEPLGQVFHHNIHQMLLGFTLKVGTIPTGREAGKFCSQIRVAWLLCTPLRLEEGPLNSLQTRPVPCTP